jgi:hypothetical protein
MANTYQWAINSMNAYPQFAGQQDVVFQVSWVCSGTDGTYNAAEYGITDVTYVANSAYTPYNELTLPQVIGWVQSVLGTDGVAQVESALNAQIAAMAAPSVVTPPLPWNVS